MLHSPDLTCRAVANKAVPLGVKEGLLSVASVKQMILLVCLGRREVNMSPVLY